MGERQTRVEVPEILKRATTSKGKIEKPQSLSTAFFAKDKMFYLIDGLVGDTEYNRQQRRIVTHLYHPEDLIGAQYLHEKKYPCRLEAFTPIAGLLVEVNSLVQDNEEGAAFLTEQTRRQAREYREHLKRLSFNRDDGLASIAFAVLAFYTNNTIRVPRQVLGDYVNADRASISRRIKDLTKRGWIDKEGNQSPVKIVDREKLEQLADRNM